MKYINLIFFLFFFVTSCKDEDKLQPNPDKDYLYVNYESPIIISNNDSLLLDINNNSLMDLIIKSTSIVNQTDTLLLNEVLSLHDSLKLSFGTRYSSVFCFINLGDTINFGNVQWTNEIPISGIYNSNPTGIWGANNINNGYIAIKLSDNKFGWIELESTDSTISILEYYMQRINKPFLVIQAFND